MYQEYVKAELLILIPITIYVGTWFKASSLPDPFIPVVLGVIDILLAMLYIYSTEGITPISTFTAITQGLLCAAGAVYGNQVYKQMDKDE